MEISAAFLVLILFDLQHIKTKRTVKELECKNVTTLDVGECLQVQPDYDLPHEEMSTNDLHIFEKSHDSLNGDPFFKLSSETRQEFFIQFHYVHISINFELLKRRMEDTNIILNIILSTLLILKNSNLSPSEGRSQVQLSVN